MTIMIGFEGISCVGKTTLIERLFTEQDIPHVAEINKPPKEISDQFEIQEWFFKNTLFNLRNHSKNHSKEERLIFDRTFFSSLAYTISLDKINKTRSFPTLLNKYKPGVNDSSNYPDVTLILTDERNLVAERIQKKFQYHKEWSNSRFVNSFDESLLHIIHGSGKSYDVIKTSGFRICDLYEDSRDNSLRPDFSIFLTDYYGQFTQS